MRHDQLMKLRERQLESLFGNKPIKDEVLLGFFDSAKKLFELVAFVRYAYGCDETKAIELIEETIEAKATRDLGN